MSQTSKYNEERPDSEAKEAGKDAESDEEVEEGGEKELPGVSQNQNQVRELYFLKLVCRFDLETFSNVLLTWVEVEVEWLPVFQSIAEVMFV